MSLYKRPESEIWWVSISVPNAPRLRETTGTTDRQEAQRIHDRLKAEAWDRPKLSGHTWGQAVLHWSTKETRSESELLSLAKFARVYKDRSLTHVTRENIHEALSFCKTAGTYTRYRTMIAAILNAAKEEGWLKEPPRLATRKDKKKKTREWLTHEQWAKLLAELPRHQKLMATFAIETGLRQSNVLGLTWDKVDMKRALVWVEAEDTKGNAALAVPLSEGAMRVLQTVQGTDDVFVFTFRGKPIKEIKTAFQAACVRAGVGNISSRDGKNPCYHGFTWHGFRHTWATWHVQAGTPLEVLQKLGGWSDLRMVMNYAHHSPGHLASFANNIKKP